jgi:hypothetical protein
MADTTDINSLPTVQENVVLDVKNKQQQYVPQSNIEQQPMSQLNNNITPQSNTNYNPSINPQQQSNAPQPLSQNEVQEMLSVVNKAAEQNITDLPSRDIPMQQSNISTDPQITPEFIPQSNNVVENDHEIYDELIRRKKQKLQQNDTLDTLYSDLELPILCAIIFFIFQLPSVHSLLYKYFPNLFLADGNPGLWIFILKTSLFSFGVYSLTKGIKYFSKF